MDGTFIFFIDTTDCANFSLQHYTNHVVWDEPTRVKCGNVPGVIALYMFRFNLSAQKVDQSIDCATFSSLQKTASLTTN